MKSGPEDNPLCNYYVITNSWANEMTFENFYSIKHVIYCCNSTYMFRYIQCARNNIRNNNGVILKSYKSVLENVPNTLRRCSVLAKVFATSIIEI